MKTSISVIILTYNEELNLSKCLASISGWADEIIIIDSFSSDATKKIGESFGAKIFEHEFKNQAEQFNWALNNVPIKNEWILRLDADEYLIEELKQEITEILSKTPEETSGYYIKRRVYFMGRWIRHGGYYPTWILRLFRKGKARVEDREMDEHIVILSGKTEKLKNDFVDDNKKDLSDWTAKHNNYSTREARERIKSLNSGSQAPSVNLSGQANAKRIVKNNFYSKLPLFFRALLYFIYRYLFRLGFLDGKEGLIFHFLQGFWHQFMIDAKIYEQKYLKTKN